MTDAKSDKPTLPADVGKGRAPRRDDGAVKAAERAIAEARGRRAEAKAAAAPVVPPAPAASDAATPPSKKD